MFIKQIIAKSFRNFDDLNLELNDSRIFIKGVNGSGKTNILELVYFLSRCKPFKTHSEDALIKIGSKEASIYLKFEKDNEEHSLSSLITRGKKVFAYDDEKVNKLTSIFGQLITISYIPKSVYLFKSEPAEKRSFIDEMCSMINPQYLETLQRYRKLLKERNQAFIKDYDQDIINVYAEQLIPLAKYIVCFRNKILEKINPLLQKYYLMMFGSSDIKLVYKTNCPLVEDESLFKEQMMKLFNDNKTNEHLRKQTLYGPHRDSFFVLINGKDIASYGSQGQNRLATLSLNLAKKDIYLEFLNQEPILLLDDVISDLDEKRIISLLETVKNSKQVIITGSTNSNLLKEYKTYEIQNGKIIKE